jgi:concanavalin A-like lectin/glucanase superfamily protein
VTYGAVAYASGSYAGTEAAAPVVGVGPIVAVEVSFANPGATPTWLDVTAAGGVRRFRHAQSNRGRQRELQQFQAGDATVTLDNRDRRFDPSYTSSPHSPDVVPQRRLRLRATYAGATYDLWAGFVDSWNQNYVAPREAAAVVAATDGFEGLAQIDLPSPWYEVVRGAAPKLWLRLGDPSGNTTAADIGPTNFVATAVGSPTFGAAGLVAADDDTAMATDNTRQGVRIDNPAAAITGSGPFSVEFWFTPDIVTGGEHPLVGQLDLGATNGWAVEQLDNVLLFVIRTASDTINEQADTTVLVAGTTYHVVAVYNNGTYIYVNGVLDSGQQIMAGSLTANPISVGYLESASAVAGFDGTIDEVAIYDRALSATEVAAHYDAGKVGTTGAWGGDRTGVRIGRVLDAAAWPTSDREIDTGQTTLISTTGETTALAHAQDVANTEAGAFFITKGGNARFVERHAALKPPYSVSKATFGDGVGEIGYESIVYDQDTEIRNEIKVSRVDGVVQVASDATSQTRYRRRVRSDLGLLHRTDLESRDRAAFLLGRYKDPVQRISEMVVKPRRNPSTMFPVVLGLELGDRVTVKRRPQNVGAAISQEVIVEGIEHDYDPDDWTVRLRLSPANALAYWILDDTTNSVLGSTTRLAY